MSPSPPDMRPAFRWIPVRSRSCVAIRSCAAIVKVVIAVFAGACGHVDERTSSTAIRAADESSESESEVDPTTDLPPTTDPGLSALIDERPRTQAEAERLIARIRERVPDAGTGQSDPDSFAEVSEERLVRRDRSLPAIPIDETYRELPSTVRAAWFDAGVFPSAPIDPTDMRTWFAASSPSQRSIGALRLLARHRIRDVTTLAGIVDEGTAPNEPFVRLVVALRDDLREGDVVEDDLVDLPLLGVADAWVETRWFAFVRPRSRYARLATASYLAARCQVDAIGSTGATAELAAVAPWLDRCPGPPTGVRVDAPASAPTNRPWDVRFGAEGNRRAMYDRLGLGDDALIDRTVGSDGCRRSVRAFLELVASLMDAANETRGVGDLAAGSSCSDEDEPTARALRDLERLALASRSADVSATEAALRTVRGTLAALGDPRIDDFVRAAVPAVRALTLAGTDEVFLGRYGHFDLAAALHVRSTSFAIRFGRDDACLDALESEWFTARARRAAWNPTDVVARFVDRERRRMRAVGRSPYASGADADDELSGEIGELCWLSRALPDRVGRPHAVIARFEGRRDIPRAIVTAIRGAVATTWPGTLVRECAAVWDEPPVCATYLR